MPYADPDQRRAFMRERQRLWRAANPERARANARRTGAKATKAWRKAHPEAVKAQNKARWEAHQALVREQKGSTCQSCGGEFPSRRLHFHHRDPATKSFTIGDGRILNRSLVEAEIAKCDVLCSPCHNAAHRELRGT